MPPALNPPVPSLSLLRFLRSQSQGLAFFDASHRGYGAVTGTTADALIARPSCGAVGRSRQRTLCTSNPRRSMVMQAGLWDLDSILQRSFRKQRSGADNATERSRLFSSPRYSSSDPIPSAICRPTWREILWARATGKGAIPLKPEDLPLRDERGGQGSIFSPSRTQAAKAALEPRLRCTEVDENGDVILTDGEFKKSELIAKV